MLLLTEKILRNYSGLQKPWWLLYDIHELQYQHFRMKIIPITHSIIYHCQKAKNRK